MAMTGCDQSAPPDLGKRVGRLDPAAQGAPGAAPRTDLWQALGLTPDAGFESPAVDPPAPAGDLKAELARFTTLDACVDERARVDPIVGDALEAIGYDTFLRDACRVLDATKAGDPSRCAAIEASSLEVRCRATVAEVSAAPDACPWEVSSRRARGRDPRCLAVASRDLRLCAGVVDRVEKATCEATLAGSARPCTALRLAAEQARCMRDAERWKPLVDVPPGRGTAGDTPPFAMTGTLHVEAAPAAPGNPTPTTPPMDVDLAPDLAHGVTLVVQRDGTRIVLGALAETGPDFVAPSPETRASLALELFAPGLAPQRGAPAARLRDAGPADAARVERAQLLVPGHPALATPGAESSLVAVVSSAALVRGSALTIEVHGDIAGYGGRWRVRLTAETFVRDIVTSADLFGGALPRESAAFLGGDAGMR